VLSWHIQDMAFFRVAPFILKRYCSSHTRTLPSLETENLKSNRKIDFYPLAKNSDDGTNLTSNKEIDFYPLLTSRLDNMLPNPTLHAYHTRGGHFPFYLNNDGKIRIDNPKWDDISAYEAQVRGSFNIVLDFLDSLRKKELYHNSTIILVSDHGNRYISKYENDGLPGNFTPMLMIKPIGSVNEYNESEAPMSSGLIPDIVNQITDTKNPALELQKFIQKIPETRTARVMNKNDTYTDFYISKDKKYTTENKNILRARIDESSLEEWKINETYSSSLHSNEKPIPAVYTSKIDCNTSLGFTIYNQSNGEMWLRVPSNIKKLDLHITMSFTITGELIITNLSDGKKYLIKLPDGKNGFKQQLKLQQIIVDGINIPEDKILRLQFDVNGKDNEGRITRGHVSLYKWKLTTKY